MPKSLPIKHLDEIVKPFSQATASAVPRRGWIETVRRALGMPAKTLARRLGVGPSQVTRFGQREEAGAITMASLRRVADALECDVVYAFVPRGGSFQSILEHQVRRAATTRLAAVEHTMALEAQPVDADERDRQFDELVRELLRDRPASIWDVDPAT